VVHGFCTTSWTCFCETNLKLQLPFLTVEGDPSFKSVSSYFWPKTLVNFFSKICWPIFGPSELKSAQIPNYAQPKGQICRNVLYETVRNNFTAKWKDFLRNGTLKSAFHLQPSLVKSMSCELFIFYYNCIQSIEREKCHKSCKLCTLTR